MGQRGGCFVMGMMAGLVWALPASGQVNAERFRQDLRDQTVALKLDSTFLGQVGNVEGVTLGFGLFGGAHVGRHLAFVRTTADYARVNDTTTIARTFLHGRYNMQLWGPWSGEFFAQIQQDRFQRLVSRTLIGLGPRLALFDRKELGLYTGISYMFEREVLNVAPDAPDESLTTGQRLSAYLSFSSTLAASTSTNTVIYYQPRLDDWRDTRLLLESSIVQKLTKTVGARLSVTMRHDSRPPTGVKQTDVEIRNVIE
ncbi:MAG: DUF481 domain-containing protein, partial [Myxococcales bacterium]